MVSGKCNEAISELYSLVGTRQEMCIQRKSKEIKKIVTIIIIIIKGRRRKLIIRKMKSLNKYRTFAKKSFKSLRCF